MEANGNSTVFMQGNVPYHVAKSIKGFLPSRNIGILRWLPKPPDINPIENNWSFKKKIL